MMRMGKCQKGGRRESRKGGASQLFIGEDRLFVNDHINRASLFVVCIVRYIVSFEQAKVYQFK